MIDKGKRRPNKKEELNTTLENKNRSASDIMNK